MKLLKKSASYLSIYTRKISELKARKSRFRLLANSMFAVLLLGIQATAFAVPNPIITTPNNPTNGTLIPVNIQFSESVSGFDVSDIEVTNGSAGDFVAVDGANYTANITPSAEGTINVKIPAGVAQNAFSENNTLIATDIIYDSTPATPVITTALPNPTNTNPLAFQIDFGENTTGFVSSDITITNGLVGNFVNVDGAVYTVDVTPANPSGEDAISLSILANSAEDIAGNNNAASNVFSINYDGIAPDPVITTTEVDPTANSLISYTLNFGEVVSGLALTDFAVTNGTTANLNTVDNQTYTFDIAPTSEGLVSIILASGAVQDAVANPNSEKQFNITYSITAPAPVISSSKAPATDNQTIPFSIDFGQVVKDFDESDLIVTNGSISNFSPAGNSQVYTFDIMALSENVVTVNIDADAAKSLSNVSSVAAAELIVAYDITRPSVTFSTVAAEPILTDSFVLNIDFSEPVTGFTLSDIAEDANLGSVIMSNLQSSDNIHWTADATIASNGAIRFKMYENNVFDAANHGNTGGINHNLFEVHANRPVTLTGTVYSDEAITPVGAGKKVTMIINGAAQSTTTDATGQYTFTGVNVALGDKVAFFLDGNVERGVLITTVDDSDSSTMDIYDKFLIINTFHTYFLTNENIIDTIGANSEIARVVSGTGSDLEVVANTEIRVDGRYNPNGSINKNKSANITLDVNKWMDLRGASNQEIYISGDIEAITSGSILTVDNNSHIIMGFDGANETQIIYGDNSYNYLDFGPSTTSHTLCLEEDKIFEMEHFTVSGAAPIKHKIRTCDSQGTVLSDGSKATINPTVSRAISDVDYRDNRNISGHPINPANSVDSGNNEAWLSGQLMGIVFDDTNGNGSQDAGEPGISSKELKIYNDVNGDGLFDFNEALIDTTTTDANGNYVFAPAAGTYFIVAQGVEEGVNSKLLTLGAEGSLVTIVEGAPKIQNFGYGACPASPIIVDTTADDLAGDGKISFREAVLCAQSGDSIEFDASLEGQKVYIDRHTAFRRPLIDIDNKNVNINIINKRNITLQASTYGNGVGVPSSLESAFRIDDADVNISNIKLTGGRATAIGGLEVTGDSNVYLKDVNLQSVVTRWKSNHQISGTSNFTMEGGSIYNNQGQGAPMNITTSGDIAFDGVYIHGNVPNNNGGSGTAAITYRGSGNFRVKNSTFYNNGTIRSATIGSAIQYLGSADPATKVAEISNSTFYSNWTDRAVDSGAIYVNPTAAMNLQIYHSTFTHNYAKGGAALNGGGIFIDPATDATVTLNQTVISDHKIGTDTDVNLVGKVANFSFNKSIIDNEYRDGVTVTRIEEPTFATFAIQAGDSIHNIPPAATSSLVDSAGVTSLDSSTLDQRGVARKLGDGIDIGAVEFNGSSKIKEITGSVAEANHKLNDVIDIKVTFYSAVEYSSTSGGANIVFDVAGVNKTAILDSAKTAAASANTLVFSYVAETNLLDTDGIDVLANSLTLNGDAAIKGPGGFVDADLTFALQNLDNDHVDTVAPTVSFTLDTDAGPVLSDIVQVSISDTQPNPASYAYAFSVDALCDASDDYSNALTSGSPFSINDDTHNTQYICVKAEDMAGNNGYARSTHTLNIDSTAPAATLSSVEPIRTASGTIVYTITFSEPVNGFTVDDLNVTGGQVGNFTTNGDGTVYTFEVTPDGDGLITVNLPANAATDGSGIGNGASTIYSVSDTVAPQPVFSSTAPNPTNTSPIPVTIDFGEVVSGFTESDIVLGGNAQISSFTSIGNRFFNIEITPLDDGDITLNIAAAVAIDSVGINNLVAQQFSINYDAERPDAVVSSTEVARTAASPIPVTITFNDTVDGLELSELVVENATLANLVKTDASTYTVEVRAIIDGEVTLQVPASVALDDANNANNLSNLFSIEFDSIGPKPVIASNLSSPTAVPAIPVTIDFAEAVTDFDASDLIINNGSIAPSSFTGVAGDSSYSFTLVATTDGPVTVNIDVGVAKDSLNNNSQAADPFSIVFDTTGPTPVIDSSASSPTSAPFTISVDFSEAVTGVEESDISVSNGSVQAGSLAGGPQIYTMVIVPNIDGDIFVNIPANSAIDSANNPSHVATQFTIVYDSTLPTPVISSTEMSPTNNNAIPLIIDFQEDVTGFVENELVVSNGSIQAGSLAGGPQIYTATLVPTNDAPVTVNIAAAVAQDASNNNSTAAAPFSIVYDTVQPTVVISSTEPKNPTNNILIPVTISFSEVMTGFELTDVVVNNGTASNFATTDNQTFTINVTPTADGLITINVAATIAKDATGNDNQIAAQYSITYDSAGPQPTISSTLTGPTNATPIPVVIDFSESVNGFSLADINVVKGSVGNFQDLGNGKFGVDITPQNGLVTVNVENAAATDPSGNNSVAATEFSINYDGVSPTPVISTTAGNPTATSPVPVTINFAETVTGFAITDMTVSNGNLSNLQDLGNGLFSATLTPVNNGAVSIDITSGIAQDAVSNNNNAAIQFSITYDTSTPIPVISSTESSPSSSQAIPLTIDFDDNDMTGFEASDIVISNGSLQAASFAGGPRIFTATLVPSVEGEVTVDIANSVAQNAAGTNNQAASTFAITYDVTAPTPVILSTATTSPGTLSPIPVVINFGENVTGFELADITIGNGTADDFTKVSDSVYTINVTPTTGGEVTVDIAAGVAQDEVSIDNLVAVQYKYNYDTASLSVADVTVNESAATATVTVTLAGVSTAGTSVDYAVTDGTAINGTDFTATNGTLNFTGTDGEIQTFDIAITDDNLLELEENLTITLSSLSNPLVTLADDTATLTITDNDAAIVSVVATDSSATEDSDAGEFTISLSSANATGVPITVGFTLSGNANEINDYSFVGNSITIPVGASSAIVAINPIDDVVFDGPETIVMTLNTSSDVNTTIAATPNNEATVSLADNDDPIGPGGVALNVMLWLKADQGITETAGAVSGWVDQSGNSTVLSVPATTLYGNPTVNPAWEDNLINFNPAIRFNQNGAGPAYLSTSTVTIGDNKPYTKVVVFKRNDDSTNMALVASAGNPANMDPIHGFYYPAGSRDVSGWHGANQGGGQDIIATTSGSQNLNEYAIAVLRYDHTGTLTNVLRINGNEEASNNNIVAFNDIGTQIGADQHGSQLDGEISEVVVYGEALSDTNMQSVESYLALKYGLTLDQSTPVNYQDNAGNIFWNTTIAGTFNNNVFGIGRDDKSRLGQIKSKSVNSDAIITLEADNEGTNATPVYADMGDLEYLMLSNQNGGAVWTTTDSPASYNILQRSWQVQQTGDVGDVKLSFDIDDPEFDIPALLNGTNYYLIIDSDADGLFADETPVALSDDSGLQSIIVSLANGKAFTLATEINDAPVITSTAVITATEDVAYTYTVAANDSDANDTQTWSLSGNPAGMSIDNGGVITWTPGEGVTTSGAVTVTVTDSGSLTDTQAFTVSVNAVNDAPVITSTAITTATEDVVYTYTAAANDSDANDTQTWSLSGNPVGMSIDNAGVITWTPGEGITTSGAVTVTVTDSGTLTDTQAFTVSVNAVNDAPVITSTAITTATEDVVYTYTAAANDSDANDTQTWSLSGNPAGMSIDNAGVITWTPSEGVTTSGAVTVTVTDSGSLTDAETFTVAVTIVDDIKPILAVSTGTVEENSATGTAVGNVSITNVGDSAITVITLSGTGAENFDVATDGSITVKAGASIDFETTQLYNLSAVATNGAGDSASVTVDITVTDAQEISTLIISNIDNSEIAENIAFTSTIPSVSGAIGILVYGLEGEDAGLFTVEPGTGVISMIARDYEAPADAGVDNAYNVTLKVTDADNNTATKAIIITVTDVIEIATLVIEDLSDSTVVENNNYASATPNVTGGAIGTLTYSIEGTDAGLFSVDTVTGVISMPAQNFEAPADADVNNVYVVTLKVIDSDGNEATHDIAVTVTDEVETSKLEMTALVVNSSVEENTEYTSETPVVISAIGALTYSLDGEDAGLFTVDPATGIISMVARDFEAAEDVGADNDYNVILKVTDADNNTTAEAIVVTVTDVTEVADLIIEGLSDETIAENAAFTGATPTISGGAIGSIFYTIEGADAGLLTVDRATGVISMVGRDYENPADTGTDNVYGVVLRVTDADGNTATQPVFVTVTDEVETSTLTLTGIDDTSVVENTEYTSATPAVTGAIGMITYSLEGEDAGLFTVDSSTGVISLVAQDFESPADAGADNDYNVTLKATDSDNNSVSKAIVVTVTNTAETAALSLQGLSNSNVIENIAYDSVMPTVVGDPIGDMVYSLEGEDADKFTVDPQTGAISMFARDYDAPVDQGKNNTYKITLRVTDSDGNTATLSIEITILKDTAETAQRPDSVDVETTLNGGVGSSAPSILFLLGLMALLRRKFLGINK